MRQKIVIRIVAGLLVAGLGFGVASFAEAGTGLTIQPIKINRVLKPGAVFSDKINVANQSDGAVNVEIKAEDFVPLAGQDTYQFIGRAPGVTTVRDWITFNFDEQNKNSLATSTLILQKDQRLDFSYTITVPPDAEPGSHFGVIFLKAIKQDDFDQQLKIGTQLGVLVFVTVPGNYVESGKITDFSVPRFIQRGPVPFKFTFQNTGTVHLAPSGKIDIKNIFGRSVGRVDVSSQAVLPTGARHLGLTWETDAFLFGVYQAKIILNNSKNEPMATAEATFYALPWLTLSVGVVSIIIIFLLLRLIKRRVRFSISLKS